VLELVDARLGLEPAIAAAAARIRTPEALSRLENAAANALQPPVGDTRPAMHFHVALAAVSGNKLLEESIEALLHQRVREQLEIRHRYDDRERDHTEHVDICAAVRGGDAAAAERLTRIHLESIRSAIEAATFPSP
jgi:DNA-binding FadR family transcriptional regulator